MKFWYDTKISWWKDGDRSKPPLNATVQYSTPLRVVIKIDDGQERAGEVFHTKETFCEPKMEKKIPDDYEPTFRYCRRHPEIKYVETFLGWGCPICGQAAEIKE